MSTLKNLFKEKNIHLFFRISLIFKGVDAFFESAGGLLVYLIPKQAIVNLVQIVTQEELTEDSHDFIANYLLHGAQHLSLGAQNFAALYLLGHGVIKLWLVIGLLRGKLWYYPVAILVFSLFLFYQFYLYFFDHSSWLLVLTVLDLAIIVLTWHEYRFMKRRNLKNL